MNEGIQSDAFSLSLWFNTDTKEKAGTLLAWDLKGYYLELMPGGRLHCGVSFTNNYFQDFIHQEVDLADGRWHYVVMSLADNTFQVYVDGKKSFISIHSSEAKKVSFTHKSTKKELEQKKMKPAEYVPLMQLKLGMGEFAYKVE